MKTLKNPHRGTGLDRALLANAPFPGIDAAAPRALLARCPADEATAMALAPALAARAGVAEVWVKDERARMGLGSFKALGAAYVIACEAATTGRDDLSGALAGRCFITASAGNHGLSVAAGARLFGARAVVVLADTVPEGFAARLREKGAEVVRAGADYAASMQAAQDMATDNGWTLLSDSSWPGYMELPHRLMEGYLALAAEAVEQMPEPPTHILLQAGVGGLAGACAAYFRAQWGDDPHIIVVEPEAAPALIESVRAGRCVETVGPVSNMGRLDCKAPSLIALAGLARDADLFVTLSEEEAEAAMAPLVAAGLATTPSGGAGIAALLAGAKQLAMGPDARVLAILSEEPEA